MHPFFKIFDGLVINHSLKQPLRDHSKSTSLAKWHFLTLLSPCHNLPFFCQTLVPSVWFTKMLQTTTRNRAIAFSISWLLKHINIIIKEVEKVRNCSFNLFENSLLHINTNVLRIYVDKMVELNTLDLVI